MITFSWFALPIQAVRGDTVTVCETGCDYVTIQEAIDSPLTQEGDTISVEDDIHTELGIVLDKGVSIVGAGASETIIQAHEYENRADDRVFTVDSGVSVTIRDVTVRHGRVIGYVASGGGILNNGTLTLERAALSYNRAVGSDGLEGGRAEGGGVFNNGSLTVGQSTISDNKAKGGHGAFSGADGGDGHGGGIANGEDGVLVVSNSTISGNLAQPGSGAG